MTARSKRRIAELAVIEAARCCHVGDANLQPAVARLSQAVRDLDALGLEQPGQVYAGTNHPETAHDAAEWMKDRVGTLASEVFISIAQVYTMGGWGLTTDQLEQRLSGSHQSVSPRVTELRDKGWIKDSGHRRKTRSGRSAVVWQPTGLGVRAWNLLRYG